MPGYLVLSMDQLLKNYYETSLEYHWSGADYSDNVVIQGTSDSLQINKKIFHRQNPQLVHISEQQRRRADHTVVI